MKMRKIFAALAAGTMLSLMLGMNTFAARAVIDDRADLLSYSEEESLQSSAGRIASARDLDLMLVTTDDAEGMGTQEYAETYFDRNYTQEDAVVYLIDMDNREIHLRSFGKSIDYLTDSRISDIMDQAYERISDSDYKGTFEAMLSGTDQAFADGVPQNSYREDEDTGEITPYKMPKKQTPLPGLIGALVGLISGGSFFRKTKAQYAMETGGYEYEWRSHHKADISVSEDRLVNQFVTQRRIPRNPPPSGPRPPRPSGGGSTVHTGVGGHVSGGGGRKF